MYALFKQPIMLLKRGYNNIIENNVSVSKCFYFYFIFSTVRCQSTNLQSGCFLEVVHESSLSGCHIRCDRRHFETDVARHVGNESGSLMRRGLQLNASVYPYISPKML